MSRLKTGMILAAAVACWAGEARAGFAWLGDWQATGNGTYWLYSDPGKVTGVAHALFAVDSDGNVDLTRTYSEGIVLTRQFEIFDAPDGLPIEVQVEWSSLFGIFPGRIVEPEYSFNLADVLTFSWHLEDHRGELPSFYGNFSWDEFHEASVILPEGIHTVTLYSGTEVSWTPFDFFFDREVSAQSLLTATIRPVPEPASIALMGLGCLGLALASRRLRI